MADEYKPIIESLSKVNKEIPKSRIKRYFSAIHKALKKDTVKYINKVKKAIREDTKMAKEGHSLKFKKIKL